MKKSFLTTGLLLCFVFTFAQKTIAIKCGHLLDTRNGQVLNNQVVFIRGNIIESIVATAAFKQKADSIIDLSSYYLLPGLIDCHTHVLLQSSVTSEEYEDQLLKESIPYRTLRASRSTKLALGYGFTSIRDLGTEGAFYADVDVKRAINMNVIPGPRMFVVTRAISSVGHYALNPRVFNWALQLPKGIQEINGAAEARKAVREQLDHGADWIKIYADRNIYKTPDGTVRSRLNFTGEELLAISDETIQSGKKIAAHAVTRDGIIAAINAGAATIEHAFAMDDECIQLMAQKKIYWCPTIFATDLPAQGRPEAAGAMDNYFVDVMPSIFQKAMHAGVKIAYGTDIGAYSWDEPEAKDFEYMVKFGMTNLQAIQTATTVAAQLLGMEGKTGEIKNGAFADIIAVLQDPLHDIKALQQVQWVMKDGVVYKSAK